MTNCPLSLSLGETIFPRIPLQLVERYFEYIPLKPEEYLCSLSVPDELDESLLAKMYIVGMEEMGNICEWTKNVPWPKELREEDKTATIQRGVHCVGICRLSWRSSPYQVI